MSAIISLAFILGSVLIVEHVREKHHEIAKRTLIEELTKKQKEKDTNENP